MCVVIFVWKTFVSCDSYFVFMVPVRWKTSQSIPLEGIWFLSAEASPGDDWEELDARGGRHPMAGPVLIVLRPA